MRHDRSLALQGLTHLLDVDGDGARKLGAVGLVLGVGKLQHQGVLALHMNTWETTSEHGTTNKVMHPEDME